jgi:hypothetical protein
MSKYQHIYAVSTTARQNSILNIAKSLYLDQNEGSSGAVTASSRRDTVLNLELLANLFESRVGASCFSYFGFSHKWSNTS